MLIILPDPTTRRCPVHRDEYQTDSLPCPYCEGARLADQLVKELVAVFVSGQEEPQ